ncbi:MAG: 5-formyltetrahydrofolate cyclo-ligase [Myxococcales bacterium]
MDGEKVKHTLRVSMRERRPAMSGEEQLSASRAAQTRLATSSLFNGVRTVALYAALPSEVQTDALAGALSLAGKLVCYPVVRDDVRALDFRRFSGSFRTGALGVREPQGELVPLSEIDLFVVPAIAADAAGGRLGRGRGHYDATLAAAGTRALRVALLFDWQIVPAVPVDAHDQRIDAVCTDQRLLRCSGTEAPV